MKWSMLGLLALGVVAAISATVLVTSLRADAATRAGGGAARAERAPEALEKVNIILAARDLPATCVVDSGSVATQAVAPADAPEGSLSHAFEVVGKVLAVPVKAGQAFTQDCFVEKGSGAYLAAALEEGMRAVSVSLTDHAGLQGVLYPGGVVDVLVSLKLPSENGVQGEVVSSTLLQGIQVLAIEDHTVVSGDKKEEGRGFNRRDHRNITLLVNARQAVLLQLAREYGSVSLAMRGPLDNAAVDTGGVLLSELSPEYLGRLAQLTNPRLSTTGGGPDTPTDIGSAAAPADRPTKWHVEIIRGGEREIRSVPVLPENGRDDEE